MSVEVGFNFNSNSNDLLISFGSDDCDGVLDVKVDFLSDAGDFDVSPVPEVGSFNLDVDENGLVDKFELVSSLLFEDGDLDGNLEVDCVNLFDNKSFHLELEGSDGSKSFSFDSLSFSTDGKIPLGFDLDDHLSVSDGEGFNFLKVVGIDLLDSESECNFSF